MKKLLSGLLLICFLLGAAACRKNDYPPVPSTDEEKTVVLTFQKEDGKKYEVPYELYRAIYLSQKQGDGSEDELREQTIRRIAEIYAVFALAEQIGFHPFAASADKDVQDMVRLSVEGGDGVIGFGGDYDAYLASLREMYLNYGAQDLLFRYSLSYDAILEYHSDPQKLGAEEIARQTAAASNYYRSDACVQVLLATLDSASFTRARAQEIRDGIAAQRTETDVRNRIIQFTATAPDDVNVGMLIGTHSLDDAYFAEVTRAAFALGVGETSEPIEVSDGITSPRYLILYRVEKSEEYAERHADVLLDSYRMNEIGKSLEAVRLDLLAKSEKTDFLTHLDHALITMDE